MSMEAASSEATSDGKGKEPLKKRLALFRCGEGIHLLATPSSSSSGASLATTTGGGGGRPRSVSNSRPSSPRVSSSSNLASLAGGADSILAFSQNNSSSTNLTNLATTTATSSSIVDPGLSEKGWEDARALKSAFELSLSSVSISSSSSSIGSSSSGGSSSNVYSIKPDVIITSTLKRALQTTSILKEQFPSIKAVGDELCRESLTRYEYNRRSPISELAAEFTSIDFSSCTLNEDSLHSTEHNADFRELYSNLRSRAGRFLAFIEQSSHQNVIVISHNHFIRNLLAEVVGIDKNHCLTAIKHGKGVSLSWTLDDGWHLETPLQSTPVALLYQPNWTSRVYCTKSKELISSDRKRKSFPPSDPTHPSEVEMSFGGPYEKAKALYISNGYKMNGIDISKLSGFEKAKLSMLKAKGKECDPDPDDSGDDSPPNKTRSRRSL